MLSQYLMVEIYYETIILFLKTISYFLSDFGLSPSSKQKSDKKVSEFPYIAPVYIVFSFGVVMAELSSEQPFL
jgi:hypothetical protein